MQRLIRYCAGWVMATTLATGVSWVAIQNLVTTAALSQPSAPYVATALTVARPTPTSARATTVGTPARTASRPSARPTRARVTPTPSSTAGRAVARPTRAAATATATSEATVQGYALKGGQVVLELQPDSASLVSAIPAADYTTETWKTDYWIRVDFVNGDRRSSVIVSWYNHAPTVDQTEF